MKQTIHLIVQYYRAPEPARQEEIDACLRNNLDNALISQVHLLTEKEFDLTSFPHRDKIVQTVIGGRLTYEHAFRYAKEADPDGRDIWVLANADIWFDESLAWDYQTANVVENLRACMEICEPAGLALVLEPLNPKNHPGLFLTKIAQAYQICKAVNSPSCKIIDDIYHQQITEGNLIPNIEAAWEEIGSFHLGDNPGRKEPTTGEINYRNVFRWIRDKGYQGVLCMEHGQSKPGIEGERAVIDAYRACDQF